MFVDVLSKFIGPSKAPHFKTFNSIMVESTKISYQATIRKLNALERHVVDEEKHDITRCELLAAITSGKLHAARRKKQPLQKCIKLFREFEKRCMGHVYGPCVLALTLSLHAEHLGRTSEVREILKTLSEEAKRWKRSTGSIAGS